jgi:hypothetical protein
MKSFFNVFVCTGSALFLQGCGTRPLDVEMLGDDKYLIIANIPVLGEVPDAAQRKVTREAEKICQREGRDTQIKNIKSETNAATGVARAEIEFGCVARNYKSSKPEGVH